MTGFWLVSYIVLWVVVIGEGLVILMFARELDALHTRLEAVERRHHRANGAGDKESLPSTEKLAED